MHFRMFIAASHEEGHHIIRNEKILYDHKKDRLYSTGGASPHTQLMGLVPDPQKIYLLGDWTAGTHGPEWQEVLEDRLTRVRHKIEDCKCVG